MARLNVVGVVFVNVIVVLTLSWLILLGQVPAMPTVAIAYPALFVIDVLLIWRASRQHIARPIFQTNARREWVAVSLLTTADIITIASWTHRPSTSLAVQTTIGALAAGVAWYFVFSPMRKRP